MATKMMGGDDISPWEGESRKHIKLSVGKLAEEANELAGICARILIQGYAGDDPGTGKANSQALAEEMADVMAAMNFTMQHTGCMPEQARIDKKLNGYKRWFTKIGLS